MGREWWCQISVDPGSAPHCRGHGSTWPAEGCGSRGCCSGGCCSRGCCSQGGPSRQSSCGHSGATGSNPPRGDQKRTFSREIREWKSFPGGKVAGRKGCCDGVVIFVVWASFNMVQFTVQGWHNDVNMMQAGSCRIFVSLTNGCNFWCTWKCFWLWSRSVVQEFCMKCRPLQM